MRRFIVFILFFLVVAGIGGYFYYHKQQSNTKIDALVPSDAFLYYNSSTPIEDWNTIQKSSLGSFLFGFKACAENKIKINALLDLIPVEFPLHFTAHKVSRSDFDLIYYFEENKGDIRDLINILKDKEKWREEKRKLDKIPITEYYKGNNVQLNLCEINGWLVVSKNPILIEEVIKNNKALTFDVAQKWVVFPSNFNGFLNGFVKDDIMNNMLELGRSPIVFDFIIDENTIKFTGKASSENSATPQISNVFDYIPMSTAIANIKSNRVRLTSKEGNILEIVTDIDKSSFSVDTLLVNGLTYNIFKDKKEFFYNLDDKFDIKSTSVNELITAISAITNEDVWGKSLRMREKLDRLSADSFQKLLMNLSANSDIITSLLNNDAKSFYHNQARAFSNLKYFSVQKTNTGDQSLFEIFVDLGLSSEAENTAQIADNSDANTIEESIRYTHTTPISSKPYVVRNHNTNRQEIIFQDSLNYVCLLGSDFNPLWKREVDRQLISDIKQVDVYKNNKLQYAFATKNFIYVIDRNGEDVEGYPLKMNGPIEYFDVIDYSNTRNYRFMTSNSAGELTLFNVKGEQLEPWNPLQLTAKPIEQPYHLRVGTKDYIIAVTDDNKVHCFNRRGEYYRGFPILPNIDQIVASNYNVDKAVLELLSPTGKGVKINLKGELVQSVEYKSDVIGNYRYFMTSPYMTYVVNGESVNKGYLANGELFFEQFEVVGDAQYYRFDQEKQLFITLPIKGNTTRIHPLGGTGKTIKSKQPVSCLYSSAKEKVTIYSTAGLDLYEYEFDY